MLDLLMEWLETFDLPPEVTLVIYRLVLFGLALAVGLLLYILGRFFIRRFIVRRAATDGRTIVDDLVAHRFFRRVALLPPALPFLLIIPLVLRDLPAREALAYRLVSIYLILMASLVADGLFGALADILSRRDAAHAVPVRSLFQALTLLTYVVAGVLMVSIFLQRAPMVILAALGASSAIVLLIFQDSIRGLVAGLALTGNDLLARGDWIEMPKGAVNGQVIDITLTTVKVRQLDQSLVSVPTYHLISDVFKNWRGTLETGVRHLRRSIPIDTGTVQFLTPELAERYPGTALPPGWLAAVPGNGDGSAPMLSRPTNLAAFAGYIEAYLRAHPKVSAEKMLMVRQLPPGPAGLPLEIYAYIAEPQVAAFEAVAAEIVNHVIVMAPQFDLKILVQRG